ncbi:MAG: hypothetical protein DMG36_14340 [Acidobacteria bacterium]|nr:MAG: hypothetical protein DMG36_14340 [Acidobacteriota bacterium]
MIFVLGNETMIGGKSNLKPPTLGLAWFILCLSFAVNILDELLHDFLGSYNPTVLTLYGHFSWFPRIDLTLGKWLVIVLGADVVLLLMTPCAFRRAGFMRPLAYGFATLMFLKGLGTILISALGQTVGSVRFTGGAPGVYSSPLLMVASLYLLLCLRSSKRLGSP